MIKVIRKIIESCKSEGLIATSKRVYLRFYMQVQKHTCYSREDSAHWEELKAQVGG